MKFECAKKHKHTYTHAICSTTKIIYSSINNQLGVQKIYLNRDKPKLKEKENFRSPLCTLLCTYILYLSLFLSTTALN